MLIAWENLADDGTVTATSAAASAPATNVQNEHIAKKWIAASAVASASLIFDMGSSVACGILGVLGSNMVGTGTVRLRGSDSDPTGAAGEKYDSSTDPDTTSVLPKAGYGNAYIYFSEKSARYWRIDLALGVAGTIEAGRVFLGPKWTPDYDKVEGGSMLAQDDSKVTKSYGGQSFVDTLPQRRVKQFTLYSDSIADLVGNAFAMARAAGIAMDVLAVDNAVASAYIQEHSVWGMCTASEPLVNENIGVYRQRFNIEERL